MIPYGTLVECDLQVTPDERDRSRAPYCSSTNSAKWPCSHSLWIGSTEFSMICSQLHGITALPEHADRGLRDVAVELRDQRRRQRAEVREDEPGEHLHRIAGVRELCL